MDKKSWVIQQIRFYMSEHLERPTKNYRQMSMDSIIFMRTALVDMAKYITESDEDPLISMFDYKERMHDMTMKCHKDKVLIFDSAYFACNNVYEIVDDIFSSRYERS